MLCLGHTRSERKTQPPGAQDRHNIHSLLPTWPLLPWQGNGDGDGNGPGGTAMAAARGERDDGGGERGGMAVAAGRRGERQQHDG